MKMPAQPPDLASIESDVSADRDRLMRVLRSASSLLVGDQYLHWDQLTHLPPPEGVSHHEWWLALKMRRLGLLKIVPLLDQRGIPFRYCEPDPVPERLHAIDLGAGGRIALPDAITNPETRDRYSISSLIEEAIASSQLEGALTTRVVAKEMIREGRAPSDVSGQMILNNYLTMRRMGALRNEPLTKELIFEIHRLVMEKTLKDASIAGRFRRTDERIRVVDNIGKIIHDPPPADQLDRRMEMMCEFANGRAPEGFIHPAIRSIVLHFWLAYDHPFKDGNGRTARALFYWSMLHHGYGLFDFLSISRILRKAPGKYARSFLYTETDENDLTYFILHQLDAIKQAVAELHDYIKRKTQELQTLECALGGLLVLNHRQRALIGHALRHPRQRYTIEAHRLSHNVVYQTARADLLNLAERGLLNAEKLGKTWYFTPVEDLEKSLKH